MNFKLMSKYFSFSASLKNEITNIYVVRLYFVRYLQQFTRHPLVQDQSESTTLFMKLTKKGTIYQRFYIYRGNHVTIDDLHTSNQAEVQNLKYKKK